ncbi:Folate-Biopterin transporter (FBT) Family [Phytophthora palmivora]|uniref:Folate-Biopterin transporter (FBT) Family n=1 Tax=Phytophthora palmivora TaxID=4796 RepID=A0A2P4XE96_9STRA|nr:Folate-Biopterin transporter (FBT) Family [Phytophthora palmivora]
MATAHHAAGVTPSKLDIPTRLSYVSGTSQTPKDLVDGYSGIKTPDPTDIEGGALREGGMPVLTSKENIGLLCQYAAVGMVYGMLPATIYPFLQQYLNCSGAQVTTASTLVVFPWSFKCFYGILSDCFPIFGYRRRPYMLLGWGICLIMLIIMACMPAGNPYYTVPSDRDISPNDYTPEIEARINYDASSQGAKYVILMFFAAFGYVMADVCADSIVVDLAQREPLDKRGKTQSCIYTVRTVFVIVGEIITGFAFNGEEYGGNFDFSLTFPQLMIIMAVCTALVIPVTWFFIKEEKQEKPNFREYLKALWDLICTRAMYQVIAYNFFSNIFSGISYTASSPVQSYIAGVTPINSTISDILGNLLFMFGIMITSKWGLHWSWRGMIVFTGCFVMIVDGICTFITVWDVFRSQWFWLGLPIAVQVPYGVGWMISNFVIVELSGIGNEGAVYGLITATHNVASPFATTLTLLIDRPFNLSTERIQIDDHSIRADISYAVIIMYAMTAFSWVFLVLLPKQKEATQELVRKGGSNKLIGGITLFYLIFALIWSVMTNIMAMFDSTSCLVIAGGDGC